jgi:hypothetical protein
MPMKLQVGASRKIADGHYGSRGASVGLEIELDGSLVLDAATLQERIRQLFYLVRQSLAEQLSGAGASPGDHTPTKNKKPSAPNGSPANGRRRNGLVRPATSAQIKALQAITQQQGVDLSAILRQHYGLERPEDLSVELASDLIGSLRSAHA